METILEHPASPWYISFFCVLLHNVGEMASPISFYVFISGSLYDCILSDQPPLNIPNLLLFTY